MANKRKNKKKKGIQPRWGMEKRWAGGARQELHKEKADSADRERMIPLEEPERDRAETAGKQEEMLSVRQKRNEKDIPDAVKEKPQDTLAAPAEEAKEEKPQDTPAAPAEEAKEEKPQDTPAAPAEEAKEEKPQDTPAAPAEEAKEEKPQDTPAASAEEPKKAAEPLQQKAPETQKSFNSLGDGEGEDEDMQRKLFLQYNNLEFSDSVMFDAAVNDYCTWAGITPEEITSVNLYVKPEEGKAYYVINEDPEKNGSIDL